MAKLKIESELTVEEVQTLFAGDMALTKHSRWGVFETYVCFREGLHLYKKPYGLYGYYESGRLDKYEQPCSMKTWCKIKVENGQITCKILHNPYLMGVTVLFLFFMLRDIFTRNWVGMAGVPILLVAVFFIYNEVFNDENAIIEEVKRRLGTRNENSRE